MSPATLLALADDLRDAKLQRPGLHISDAAIVLIRAEAALREAAASLETAQKAQQLLADLLEERADDLTREACDNCDNCTAIVMCAYHSVLSELDGGTWTQPALERDNLRRRAEAAEALCATLEGKNEQNNAIVVAIARMCDGEQPSDFMLSFGIVRAVDDLRASRDEALRQVEALEREVTQITAILDAERAMWAPELAARAAQEQS